MGELNVMNASGHLRIIWDKNDPPSVEQARRSFKELREKRYLAFSVDEKGEKNNQVYEFDQDLQKIILAPPVVGG
jgi:hypothetical protein